MAKDHRKTRSAVKLIGLALVLAACGCIRSETELTLNADGSAEFKIAYSMSEQVISQMKSVQRVRKELTEAADLPVTPSWEETFLFRFIDAESTGIERYLQGFTDKGVSFEDLEVTARNGWRHTSFLLKCRSVKELEDTDVFRAYGFSLTRTSNGDYILERKPKTANTTTPPDFQESETAKLLGPLLAGFNVNIAVTAPGRILRTTAPQNSMYKAIWAFNFDRDANAVLNYDKMHIYVHFLGRGLDLPEIGK